MVLGAHNKEFGNIILMATKKKTDSLKLPLPINCENLIGHTDIMREFMSAWDARAGYPLHHAWMLAGPSGIGKATAAYKIARIVLGGGDTPDVRERMVLGGYGDFFVVDLAHNIDRDGNLKPDAKSISVHTIRAMLNKMQMTSMSGEWRVILVDSVDELTVEAANAMLKLLEEPPANTLFLLIAHKLGNVLPTIRSRARVCKMRPLTAAQLRECAMILPPELQDISGALIKLAGGSFGKIAMLKATGGDEIYEKLISVIKNKNATACAGFMPFLSSR
jgi:DNA polymerase-3 subunit delta'